MKNRKDVILITGSSKRIGKEIVLGLSRFNKNYKFILHYNNSAKEAKNLKTRLEKDKIDSKIIKFDLSNADKIKDFGKEVERLFGRVDVLINNASIFIEKELHAITNNDFDEIINVNLKSTFLLSKFLSIGMKKRKYGKIINLTDSDGVNKTWKKYSHYCITKGGLETMTKVLSLELAPYIQVNSIAPGKILKPVNSAKDIYVKTYNAEQGIEDIIYTTQLLIESNQITGKSFKIDNGKDLY